MFLSYFFCIFVPDLNKIKNMEHECAIGLWCECDYVNCISLSELKEQQRDKGYTMKQLKDYRFGISFSEFEYCPDCGKKIDWETIRKYLK